MYWPCWCSLRLRAALCGASLSGAVAHARAVQVDAGADFILTQLFYDVDQFLKWVGDCRRVGITVPIVPGIMPINGYASWKRMTDFCKTKIPDEMRAGLEARQDDDEAVKTHGVELVAAMCQKLMDSRAQTGVPGLHMYAPNTFRVLESGHREADRDGEWVVAGTRSTWRSRCCRFSRRST